LPEVLVVIVVLGALAAATAIAMRGLRSDADVAACEFDRATVERAAALWQEGVDATPDGDQLVGAGLLRTDSDLFEFDAAGRVVAAPGGPCAVLSPTAEVAASDVTPSGGGGTESAATATDDVIEVSLAWTGNADLDVWVRTPTGELIGWTGAGAGGGHLDTDVVPATPEATGPHVERIVWPPMSATGGDYVAWADFRTPGWGEQPAASFVLKVRRGDEVLASLDGPIGLPGTSSAELVATVT
jgi:type II secretory pathway pseudopilin PulG